MYNVSDLEKYVSENSFELISKAIFKTNLIDLFSIRGDLKAGSHQINIFDADTVIQDLACGWTPDGEVNFTQVPMVIRDKQIKMELCPNDLRDYWTSEYLKASAHNEEAPFAETIANYYIDQIAIGNERYLVDGDGTGLGMTQLITGANGSVVAPSAAPFTVINAVEQVLNIYDAIPQAVQDRDDLFMVMSPSNFSILRRALVAQNYFHYNPGDVKTLEVPGANIKIVKSVGFVGKQTVIAGPAEFVVVGTGLADDFSNIQFKYDEGEDVIKMLAKWRLGIGIGQVDMFVTNGL